jgi:hypothetical protein
VGSAVVLTPFQAVRLTADSANNYFAETFGGPLPGADTSSATSYTPGVYDCYQARHFTAATTVTITIPSGLPAGCNLNMVQDGTGQLSLVGGSGFTLYSAHGYTHSYAQHAVIGVDIGIGGISGSFYGDGA